MKFLDIDQDPFTFLVLRRFKKMMYRLHVVDYKSLWQSFNDPPMSSIR
jgi:hypothetical protein